MRAPIVRRFEEGDLTGLQLLLDRCFGRFEKWTADRVAQLVETSGADTSQLWVAVDDSGLVGCVGVFELPQVGSYLIRELAVDVEPREVVAELLLDVALEHVRGQSPSLVRASTLEVPPYPAAYQRKGFTAVRRAFTLVWDLTEAPPASDEGPVRVGEALGLAPGHIAELYVEGMRPYWDWFIDERGGAKAYKERVAAYIADLVEQGRDEMWLVAHMEGVPIGLAFVTQLDDDEPSMGGVYVLPEYRGRGAGSALMRATLSGLYERGARRLVVSETISSLDSELPSLRLYKQSGARVRAEYLHLQLDIPTLSSAAVERSG